MVLEGAGIIFPNLGIEIPDFPKSFSVFGFSIAWYGVIIAAGMIVAVIISMYLAKKSNQDIDDYIDVAICSIIAAIIGARAYYVIFSWDEYKDNLSEIFNIRNGGLAIYGGIIAGVIAAVIVCRIKKISFLRVFDTVVPGLAIGQAIGRWGNFTNREAYGGYTDNLFAMQIKYSDAGGVVTDELIDNMVTIDEIEYIQVHPTFLYECIWCLVVAILILVFRKYQSYKGEAVLWYIGGYALGRTWIEGLRTDQLLIGNSGIAVSQLLSIALVAGALALLIINRIRIVTKQWTPVYSRFLEPGEPGTVEFTQAKEEARKAKKAAKKAARKGTGEESGGSEAAQEASSEELTEDVMADDPGLPEQEAIVPAGEGSFDDEDEEAFDVEVSYDTEIDEGDIEPETEAAEAASAVNEAGPEAVQADGENDPSEQDQGMITE